MKALAWKSRRPILRVQLSFTEWLDKTPDGLINPDVKAHAANTIATAKALGAQSIVTWDLESAVYPKYQGRPQLASPYAVQYNKLIRTAGYDTGCTCRWENFDDKGNPDEDAKNGFENIYRRIWHARHVLQARAIYLDSNILQDGTNRGLTTEHFQYLHHAFPDVLLIPEHGGPEVHQYAARYRELRGGFVGTPADVRAQVTGAWSVIYIHGDEPGLPRKHFDELVASVRRGDVLMCEGWHQSIDSDAVKSIYAEAART